jgi:hypothetical protein
MLKADATLPIKPCVGVLRMQHTGLGRGGILLFALSCMGCDEVVGHEDSEWNGTAADGGTGDSALQWVGNDDDGWLIPSGPVVRDGAVDVQPTKPNGKDAGQGDAGQWFKVDAGAFSNDGGTANGEVIVVPNPDGGPIDPYPTPQNPDCRTIFYRDLDADGFGDDNASVTSCTQPSGYSLIGGDCYDTNDRAHPGATGNFMAHRGDGSFDFDCDGVETLARPAFAVCPAITGACDPSDKVCTAQTLSLSWQVDLVGGWTDTRAVPCSDDSCPANLLKVPACGEAGHWGTTVNWNLLSRKYACTLPLSGETRIQACR